MLWEMNVKKAIGVTPHNTELFLAERPYAFLSQIFKILH
jgi:hypothetical protein